MSHILTRTAHKTQANAELQKGPPRDAHAGTTSARRLAPSPEPSEPTGPLERDDAPETNYPITNQREDDGGDLQRPVARGDPGDPNGDPTPPDPSDNGDNNDDDDSQRGREPGEHDNPGNITAEELLRFLGPILATRGPPIPATDPTVPGAGRLKVNSPEEFDGHSPKKLKSFLVACNNAFRADPNTFQYPDRRVSYALSYLRGSAQRHFDTQLEDEDEPGYIAPDWLQNWTLFVQELRDMFADPNAEATAEAELDALRMRANQKFADFLVEFNTLSSQVNWGDRALRHRLRHALPDRIKDSLALVEEPAGFGDWKRVIQTIDQRYWERQTELRREGRTSHNTTRGGQSANTRNTPSTPAPPTTTSNPRNNSGNPPPARSHLTTQGGLTQTERERRIAQGLCLYCGGEGHKAVECSKARKSREKPGRAAQVANPATPSQSSGNVTTEPKIVELSEN